MIEHLFERFGDLLYARRCRRCLTNADNNSASEYEFAATDGIAEAVCRAFHHQLHQRRRTRIGPRVGKSARVLRFIN